MSANANISCPTGELLRSLRPDTYRRVVDLLAEPREHVSYREIARVCKVGGSTIKAIEAAEAESIIERKAKLLRKVARVAETRLVYGRGQARWREPRPGDDLSGIATDKMILLGGDTTQRIEVNFNASEIYADFQTLTAQLNEVVRLPAPTSSLAPIDAEILSSAIVAEA